MTAQPQPAAAHTTSTMTSPSTRNVAIVAVHQTDLVTDSQDVVALDLIFDAAKGAASQVGLSAHHIETVVSGSSDMLEGRSFGFVLALEALPTQPPIHEAHVEMDGAWAAYYAWLRILAGEFNNALVVAWTKNTEASVSGVLNTQLDPFTLAPLGIDHVATAGLQADAYLRRSGRSLSELDEVVKRSVAAAAGNPHVKDSQQVALHGEVVADPLCAHHCPTPVDGACAIILAAEDTANQLVERPAWIHAAEHRIDSGSLGHRDLSRLAALEEARTVAWRKAQWADSDRADVAELAAAFAHEELMLAEALGISEDSTTVVNPSGGTLPANPLMVGGLIRLGEAALQVMGTAHGRQVEGAERAVAHASGGHALQHNLLWLLGSESPT